MNDRNTQQEYRIIKLQKTGTNTYFLNNCKVINNKKRPTFQQSA